MGWAGRDDGPGGRVVFLTTDYMNTIRIKAAEWGLNPVFIRVIRGKISGIRFVEGEPSAGVFLTTQSAGVGAWAASPGMVELEVRP